VENKNAADQSKKKNVVSISHSKPPLKAVLNNCQSALIKLNVAKFYIFQYQRAAKVENGGRIPGFLDELGSFLVIN
jgi:hypothetical protein